MIGYHIPKSVLPSPGSRRLSEWQYKQYIHPRLERSLRNSVCIDGLPRIVVNGNAGILAYSHSGEALLVISLFSYTSQRTFRHIDAIKALPQLCTGKGGTAAISQSACDPFRNIVP